MALRLNLSLGLLLALAGCGSATEGMDREIDRAELIGCYRAESFPKSIMEVSRESISFGGNTIYDRYQYGFDGRVINPIIYVWPRLIAVADGERLSFEPYRGGDGSITLTTDEIGGTMRVALPVFKQGNFPDGHLHYFLRSSC